MEANEADAFVHAVARDWRTAPLSTGDRALCEFASKLTMRQHEMTPADLEALRTNGFDDSAIHDAVQVIGYFNYITRVADALGVEDEDFIRPWGEDDLPLPDEEGT
jgi:uncharacterized peroxidase-related enzyme